MIDKIVYAIFGAALGVAGFQLQTFKHEHFENNAIGVEAVERQMLQGEKTCLEMPRSKACAVWCRAADKCREMNKRRIGINDDERARGSNRATNGRDKPFEKFSEYVF